jgi:hypothetical protein
VSGMTPRSQPVSVGDYLDELTAGVSDGWNRFWFTPTDPATLGLIRILTGLMLVYTHWVWGLQFDAFFGVHSWTSAEVVRQFQQNDFAYSFWWAVPPHLALTVHHVCLGVLVAFTLGICTRLTSIAALLIVISYAHRVPTALFGLDQINGMLTLYCAIGPSGRAYSVDNLLRRRRRPDRVVLPSIGANVAIRLIQLHMCLIYFFAGIAKLQGETWWNGLAMWYAFANREYQTMNMTWLAEYPWVINAMTHVTVLFEIGFCALIWHRLSRPLMMLLAVLLHVGIGVCMGMWTFGLVMLIGCASFLPPHVVRHMVQRRG